MRYPDIDPKTWGYKNGLEITSLKCLGCGKEFLVDIPIITKDFVGFESEDHGCDQRYKMIILKPRFEVEGLLESKDD